MYLLKRKTLEDIFRNDDWQSFEKQIMNNIISQHEDYKAGKTKYSVVAEYGVSTSKLTLNLEEYWSITNSLHFYMDISKVNKPKIENKLELFNKIIELNRDILIDFKIGNILCYILFQNTEVGVGVLPDGRECKCLNIHYNCYVDGEMRWASGGTMFPEYSTERVYSLGETENCTKCINKCNKAKLKVRYEMPDLLGGSTKMVDDAYFSSKYMQDNGNCKALSTHISGVLYQDLIEYGLYAVERYFNRSIRREETIAKNKEPKVYIENNDLQVDAKTLNKELSTQYTQIKYITLRDYKRYSQKKERKSSKHSSHSSPREHQRRGTTRRIYNKDGSLKKIVPVRGSIVNKGKTGSIVYEIRDEK